jgi:hypothetical protein
MKILDRLQRYSDSISYTQYRFDKLSNFLTFDEYKEDKILKFMKSIVTQPKYFEIMDRENKNLSVNELVELSDQDVYSSIQMRLSNSKSYGGDARGLLGVIKENSDFKVLELKATW